MTEDMVNDLEERLAWALEEADLKPGDLVTVNRKKLNIISRNALTAALPHLSRGESELAKALIAEHSTGHASDRVAAFCPTCQASARFDGGKK